MSSLVEFAVESDNLGEIPEEDLQWRRNSQAALSAMLPSHTAKQIGNRWRSITAKLIHVGQIPEEDLRWRRNSQAALSAMLPSHTTKQIGNRWRSITLKLIRAHREIQAKTNVIKTTHICSHDEDAVIEDYVQTKENIKSLTASLTVKRRYRQSDCDNNSDTSVNSYDQRRSHHQTLHDSLFSFDQLQQGTTMERVGIQTKYNSHQASEQHHQYQYDPMDSSRRDGYQERPYEVRYNEGNTENTNTAERSHFAGNREDDTFHSMLIERDQRGQSHSSPRNVEKDALHAYNKERDQRGHMFSHEYRDHIEGINHFDDTSSGYYADPDGHTSPSRPLSASFQSGYGKLNNNMQYNDIDRDTNHGQGQPKKGHTNQVFSFDDNEDQEHNGITYEKNGQVSSLRVRRGRSLSKRRRNFHRISAFIDGSEDVNLKSVNGAKTVIFRHKRSIVRSQVGAESSYEDLERMSGDEFYLQADSEGLPSEKYRKTKTLKYRMAMLKKSHHTPSTHDIADLLRDQLVREKSYEFQALAHLGYRRAKAWHNFRSHVRNLVYQLEVWAGSFKIIEGHFGTSTVSYFRFLRFLMFLNLYLTLIIFGVIVIPNFILPDVSIDNKQYIETYNCSASYRQHTEELKRNSSSAGNIALSILQGTGLLENTVLFYGNYYNMSLSVPIGGVQTYNMSLSYLMATGATFILSFLLLVKNSAKGVKQGILETSGGSLTHQFFNKVFGGWDFCVSSESTASIKHKSLKLELETDLEYQRLYWRKQNRTAKEKLKLVLIRVLINLLCFGILGASLYLIFYVNEKLITLQNEAKKITEILVLLVEYLPSVTITLLSTIVPIIFTRLILAEEYTPLFQIRLTLFRIVLLRLSSLGVLMLSLFTTIRNNEGYQCGNQNSTDDNSNFSTCENCTENDINFTTVDFIGFNETDQLQCWETYLGQQIYKLVIMNFIVVIAVTFLWEFPRKLIYMKFNHLKFVKLLGQQEFDLAKNVLDLVYLQTLSWLGLFFSPLIPAMCCLTYFIFFYVKKLSLLKNCVPHQQHRTSRSSSLFMMVLLLSFALSTIPLIYMIGSIQPSRTCGPFRNYRNEEYFIFTVITYTISNWPDEARLVFTYMGKGPVMVAFALFICLIMYYFWMVSQGYIKQEQLLREQLKLEGQDKQFLLARMNEFIVNGDKRTTTISTLSGSG